MDQEKKFAELEALLFAYGEPVRVQKIAKMLEVSNADAQALLEAFQERLKDESRGLVLLERGLEVQLATKPALGGMLESLLKEELKEDLTPAALEALSIVAYLGPISRSRIEFLRGVNSSFTLRNLLLRGLVDREKDPDRPLSYLYSPSFELLRALGVAEQEALPEYGRFRILSGEVEQETQEEKVGSATAEASRGQ